MKRWTCLLLLLAASCTSAHSANDAVPAGVGSVGDVTPKAVEAPPVVTKVVIAHPSPLNAVGSQFPRVNSDLSATFQITAPNAKSVAIRVDKDYPMTKEGNLWTVTTTPLVPGFHYYSVIIDGDSSAMETDPGAETYYGMSRMASGIEIPDQTDFYDAKDVPHGEIRSKLFFSAVTKSWQTCLVYTPPDYDTNVSARYPVLYLQHGGGEDERGWAIQGRVNYIMDNLIAEVKAKPMLIVMSNSNVGGGRPVNGAPGGGGPGGGAFGDVLLNEIVPTIESSFRVISDKDHRAMAGLSMGGMQTAQITMINLDKFSYIGCFSGGAGDGRGRRPGAAPGAVTGAASGATPGVALAPTTGPATAPALNLQTLYSGAMADPAAFDKKVKVFFFSCGSVENAAALRAHQQQLIAAGITNTYFYESPGTAHEWLTWRRSLYCFAPLLFKD